MPAPALRSHAFHRALRRYRYFAVPAAVAESFARARSKGVWFNAQIRDLFAFEEIEGDAG